MKAVKQEHFSGCAVACLASITGKTYRKAIASFTNGAEWAKFRGFYCKEIIEAFKLNNLDYRMRYVGRKTTQDYPIGTIVFLKKNSKYPTGHYLCFTENGWMDSWINFPNLDARAGFRKNLPGKPVYAIIPKEKPRL